MRSCGFQEQIIILADNTNGRVREIATRRKMAINIRIMRVLVPASRKHRRSFVRLFVLLSANLFSSLKKEADLGLVIVLAGY